MLARAERKRSRHDAPGTERKAQAQGRGSKMNEFDVCGQECPEGKRGYA